MIGWSGYIFAENLTFQLCSQMYNKRMHLGEVGALESQNQLSKTILE